MSAREAILGLIQSALVEQDPNRPGARSVSDAPSSVTRRLTDKPVSTLPAWQEEPIARMIRLMESVQMSVVRVQHPADVTDAVADYINREALQGDVTVAPALNHLSWPGSYRTGGASGVETTSVTPCLAAVAETGSVVFSSTAGTPATLNFLPDNHIVVVNESQVVRHVDDVWPQLRSANAQARAVNFVTGPSRTGDIEQTIEIGAHGPRRMHIILVAGQ